MKRFLILILSVLSAAFVPSCTKVNLMYTGESQVKLYIGDFFQIPYFVEPESTQVIWSSSNPGIADIQGGYVVARATGNVTITGKASGSKTSFNVEVAHVPATSFNFPSAVTTYIGQSVELPVDGIQPGNCLVSGLRFSSSNEQVATVSCEDETVIVKALSVGTAVITAESDKVSHKCTVTVKDGDYFVINPSSISTMYVGESRSVTAIQSPEIYTGYSWVSSMPNVLKVTGTEGSNEVVFEALSTGSSQVTCHVGPKSVSVTVNVLPQRVFINSPLENNVTFSGDKFTLTAGSNPALPDKSLQWSVSDPNLMGMSVSADAKEAVFTPKDKSGKVKVTVSAPTLNVSSTLEIEIIGKDYKAYVGMTAAVPTFSASEKPLMRSYSDFLEGDVWYPCLLTSDFYKERATGYREVSHYMSLFDEDQKHVRPEILKKARWEDAFTVSKTTEGYSYATLATTVSTPTLKAFNVCINDWVLATLYVHYSYTSIRLYSTTYDSVNSKEDAPSSDAWFDVTTYTYLRQKAETSTSLSSYLGEFHTSGFSRFTIPEDTYCHMVGVVEMPGSTCYTLIGDQYASVDTATKDYFKRTGSIRSKYYYKNGNASNTPTYKDYVCYFKTPSVDASIYELEGGCTFGYAHYKVFIDVKNVK